MIAALNVRGLAVRRGERRLFTDFGLDLAAGEAVALSGPNGAGKTSLLRAIAGFIRPDAGEVAFLGRAGPLEPEEARRSGVHLLGHQDGLQGQIARRATSCCSRWVGPARTDDAAIRRGAGAGAGAAAGL